MSETKKRYFEEANLYSTLCAEYDEKGDTERANEYEEKFFMLFDLMRAFGWEKEYMGIA